MTSDAELNANRRNARMSTGPRTAAGKAASSQNYELTVEGFTITGDGELTGTFDPATNTMSGTGFGYAQVADIAGGGGAGDWTATVDPAGGTIVGEAGDADGRATFELTFEPYTPPDS